MLQGGPFPPPHQQRHEVAPFSAPPHTQFLKRALSPASAGFQGSPPAIRPLFLAMGF